MAEQETGSVRDVEAAATVGDGDGEGEGEGGQQLEAPPSSGAAKYDIDKIMDLLLLHNILMSMMLVIGLMVIVKAIMCAMESSAEDAARTEKTLLEGAQESNASFTPTPPAILGAGSSAPPPLRATSATKSCFNCGINPRFFRRCPEGLTPVSGNCVPSLSFDQQNK